VPVPLQKLSVGFPFAITAKDGGTRRMRLSCVE